MQRNPILEFILDEMASGTPFKELKSRYNFSKNDLIQAALYAVEELRDEYISLLAKKKQT